MITIERIKERAHSLLESHIDKSRCLLKPAAHMNDWEISNFLVGFEDIGDAVLSLKEDEFALDEEMTNLEAAAFIAEAREEIERTTEL
jgi:hypothetical protein